MVSFTPSAAKIKDVKHYGWAVYEDLYPADTNDTFTCSEFIDDVNLSQALLVNNSTGATITTTIALNVVTLSQAAVSDANCTLFVYGRREA